MPCPTFKFVPFWGLPSSTLDWCEENYLHSDYIAEFYNSLTCLSFIFLSIFGIIKTRKIKEVSFRFILSYILLGVVGLGSIAFHSTLRYEMQLLDELPMLYSATLFLFNAYDVPKGITRSSCLLVKLYLAAFSLVLTVVYLSIKYPVFHQFSFGLLITISAYMTYRNIKSISRSKSASSSSSSLLKSSFSYLFSSSSTLPDDNDHAETKKASYVVTSLLRTGVILFIVGFVFWNIDNTFCSVLISFRDILGSPLNAMFQFHGWWHLLTSLGSYYCIVSSVYIKLIHSEIDCAVGYLWYIIPFVKTI